MTQNPFQPWKQNFTLSNQFYRKNDTDSSSTFNKVKANEAGPSVSNMSILSQQLDMSNDSQSYQTSVTSSNNINHQTEIDQLQPVNKSSQCNSKFSIFSQLLNLNKINAFDNLLLNASISLDDEELNNDKRRGIRKLMEQAISSDEAKQQITFILEKISTLRPTEKLLLYLKMPGGHSEVDPLKQSQNPLGSRSEISHTINWVRSHLEHDEKVSIPKQEVYEDYVQFCGKINIKPLSTADFGKVMKQVFPDIRPRRLGTRGHSRYCYAAMRKATKLQPPLLPDLSTSNESNGSGHGSEHATWNIIKSWSEKLLNAQFESADDLASHISQHNLNMHSTSTSKQLLHKKLMQRELKDKRRASQPSKKRRKKRRQSTESPDTLQENDELFDANLQIKQEKETDGSAVENNFTDESSDVPMNLSSEQARRDQQINPITVQYQNDVNDIFKSKEEPKTKMLLSSELNDEEHNDNQYVLCKKVRQAQQLKMTATTSMPGNSLHDNNVNVASPIVSSSEILHEMLMPSKIPAKRKSRKEENLMSLKKGRYQEKVDISEHSTPSPLNNVEPNDLVVKKDDLKEDFILPRERFISICNMDRNALDTYLNPNEENSQDLELLQYFGEDKNKIANCIEDDLGGEEAANVSLMENSYHHNTEENPIERNSEKLSQLRSMLEEKYNNACNITNSESVIRSLLQKSYQQPSNDLNDNDQMNAYNTTSVSTNVVTRHATTSSNNMPQCVRSVSSDATLGNNILLHSPNTRRKNFSFVPIPSQSMRPKNINLHPAFKGDTLSSPFVSPRATPLNRRVNPLLNIRNPNMIDAKSVPVLGISNTAFCRPHQFKMEPASAPQSPSMLQNYNYSPQAQQSNQFQFQTLSNQGTNYNYPVESRSQSVPPHCTNTNMFNNSYSSYSSACSSMAPTPVPSDYQEFSDSNILDIFNGEQAPSSNIKLEANDNVIDMLDNEILNQTTDNIQVMRQNFVNSRSVPNTPLPFNTNYNNNNINSFCPVGKSVPTTPISANNGNPFRYSPELQRTRDFLINGFNNHNNNNNNGILNNNTNKISKNESMSSDIDELSNLDTTLLNNL
ncbi:CLUMA_CG011169, isoform A [Clunio marinus]|uniref:CLUMA_CG011169, isoform A n=1 Tax=Clunio marinus TaxID=568069 RepID=A0A1J1IFK6_9DIPT|nr:CLUMA_CG011169, isoform A [Clunio marinus]